MVAVVDRSCMKLRQRTVKLTPLLLTTSSLAKICTMAELQSATNGLSEENFLGEGSFGSVYKADLPNGQILPVENINTVALSHNEDEQFLEVIWNAARLRHWNIVTLRGYCLEHRQHLVYDYVRNLTLDDGLHSDAYMTLLGPTSQNCSWLSTSFGASEMAITGYAAPEHIQNGFDSVKGDMSAFGVLLLELLTETRPFDGFRQREEQSLVR